MSTHLLQPIAILRTPFAEKFGVPRQGALAPAAEGLVEFLPEFSAPEYVRGLEAFSHVWLITGFHHSPWTGSAVVRPPRLGGNERVGVFATRSPNRPNGLGLTLVRLLAIEAGVLRVGGVDAVDGTPVFDVKPYLPWCESIPEAQSDWARDQPFAREEAAVHFAAGIAARLGEETATLVRQRHQTRRERLILVVRLHFVMQYAAGKPDKPAGATLGDIDLLPNRRDRLAFGLWAQGFPFTTTFNASMSSIASANSFLSRAFSASRSFSRRASETSMPPNFARHV